MIFKNYEKLFKKLKIYLQAVSTTVSPLLPTSITVLTAIQNDINDKNNFFSNIQKKILPQ